jgi:hypothetical protein
MYFSIGSVEWIYPRWVDNPEVYASAPYVFQRSCLSWRVGKESLEIGVDGIDTSFGYDLEDSFAAEASSWTTNDLGHASWDEFALEDIGEFAYSINVGRARDGHAVGAPLLDRRPTHLEKRRDFFGAQTKNRPDSINDVGAEPRRAMCGHMHTRIVINPQVKCKQSGTMMGAFTGVAHRYP